MAEQPPPPPPSPPPAPTTVPAAPPRLAGFEQLDARIKELTSSQGQLLDKIQKLKLEVQNWRSNLETQVKTSQNELLELKKGLNSEVELLKSEMKEIKSAIQEERTSLQTQFVDTEKSNEDTNQAQHPQEQVQEIDAGVYTEEQAEMEA
uniref:Uncharacterized protein n=1 Tax=Oryza brachyantha TaxID=4533 RepID=J3MNZ4_ORYBR